MTICRLTLGLGAALAIGGAALAQPNAKPMLVKSKDIDAMVAKTKDGLATAKLPTGNPVRIVGSRCLTASNSSRASGISGNDP